MASSNLARDHQQHSSDGLPWHNTLQGYLACIGTPRCLAMELGLCNFWNDCDPWMYYVLCDRQERLCWASKGGWCWSTYQTLSQGLQGLWERSKNNMTNICTRISSLKISQVPLIAARDKVIFLCKHSLIDLLTTISGEIE